MLLIWSVSKMQRRKCNKSVPVRQPMHLHIPAPPSENANVRISRTVATYNSPDFHILTRMTTRFWDWCKRVCTRHSVGDVHQPVEAASYWYMVNHITKHHRWWYWSMENATAIACMLHEGQQTSLWTPATLNRLSSEPPSHATGSLQSHQPSTEKTTFSRRRSFINV